MKKYFFYLLVVLAFMSCSKNDNSLPDPVVPTPVSNPNPTTFVFMGNVEVEKFDSNSTPLANYIIPNKQSILSGTTPDFVLSNNINASALKGEQSNSINVYIPSTIFYSFASGTGVFQGGVFNGYYSGDSLKYQMLYTDFDKNNIHLYFKGQLTNSY